MKKRVLLTLGLVSLLSMVASCNNNNNTSSTSSSSVSSSGGSTSSSSSQTGGNAYQGTGPRLEINYLRFDQNYTGWKLWTWNNDGGSFGLEFDGKITYDAYDSSLAWTRRTIEFDKDFEYYANWDWTKTETSTASLEFLGGDSGKMGIIVRDGSGNKDVSDDRYIDFSKADADGDQVYTVYLVTESKSVYYSLDEIPAPGISTVSMTSDTLGDNVLVGCSVAPTGSIKASEVHLRDESGKEYPFKSYNGYSGGEMTFQLENRLEVADLKKNFKLYFDSEEYATPAGYPVEFGRYYSSNRFDELFAYDGELGSYIDNGNTVFRLWAPTASKVTLNLYDDGLATVPSSTIELVESEKGTWSTTISGNRHGVYYSYDVEVLGETNRDVADPYGKSSNANGKHSMVVDFNNSAVLPDNWGESSSPAVSTASAPIVYETHVRDFSMSDSWNGSNANRGKYLGLSESGTTLADNSTKTGFDYVKELGVTHVQLLPIYDFKSVDETRTDDEYKNSVTDGAYNWGYDPQSYNSPEGSYSSNPNDGNTRVKELRQAIQQYNNANIGVIMDVVYNHMPSSSGTTFEQIVPGYYFRGVNDSGAGADMASEKTMFKKFIVDSTKMWMTNYKLSGFRFDLMGLITKDAMGEVSSTLHEINSDAIVYGEGWSMFSKSPNTPTLSSTNMATQGKVRGLKIGCFNDTVRDSLKGSVFDAVSPGYVTALESDKTLDGKENIKYGIVGTQIHNQVSTLKTIYDTEYTGASVNYAEAHDNETLHDKLRLSVHGLTEEQYNNIQIQVNQVIMTSLGISFYHSGTEFGRTKEIPADLLDSVPTDKISKDSVTGKAYSKDSYNLCDKINAIDWNLVKTNSNMVEAFRKAALLKTNNEMLRSNSYANINAKYVFDDCGYEGQMTANNIIAYTINSDSETDSYEKMYIVHNTGDSEITVAGHEGWNILLGGTGVASSSVTLPARTTLILGLSK